MRAAEEEEGLWGLCTEDGTGCAQGGVPGTLASLSPPGQPGRVASVSLNPRLSPPSTSHLNGVRGGKGCGRWETGLRAPLPGPCSVLFSPVQTPLPVVFAADPRPPRAPDVLVLVPQ